MSRGILVISIPACMLFTILAAAVLSFVYEQNMTNITGVNMTNATIIGYGTGGNVTASIDTQTSSALEEGGNMGMISDGPKCLGSALCRD
jgi:hypothetical protein